ncbi:MAG: class I SAM-dependent methyltransferase [Actinomycetota bacterium]
MSDSLSSKGDPWGAKSADWAEVQEPFLEPCYNLVLNICGVGPGTRVLDVGCGAGKFMEMASNRGALVTGIDGSAGMIEIARQRIPRGNIQSGSMDSLPYPANSFELVAGFNSFSHAEDQLDALLEARRVAMPGAPVAITVWAPARPGWANEAVFGIMPTILPDLAGPEADVVEIGARSDSQPREDPLAGLARKAGLTPRLTGDIDCPFVYSDEETLIKGFMSPGPFVEACRQVGEPAVRSAILSALEQFRTAAGGYSFTNGFRYVIATA